MDIFSAGCIIAEILQDAPLFDRGSLLDYKKGKLKKDFVQSALNKNVKDYQMVRLVMKMIEKKWIIF